MLKKMRVCPRCGRTYYGHPALSRVDNETKICPSCGITEALDDARIFDTQTREAIIESVERKGEQ